MAKYTQAGTLTSVEVGRRFRASRENLAHSQFILIEGTGKNERRTDLSDSARAWKVWAVCAELTASWSKASDRVHVRTIANRAGLREDKVSPILRAFHEEAVFGWVKDEGKRSAGLLTLPMGPAMGHAGVSAPKDEPEDSAPASPSPRKKACPECPGEIELERRNWESTGKAYWMCPVCTWIGDLSEAK